MAESTVASKIKQAREQAGLTQAQLAEKVGTTPQNISQYERGIRNPKLETIEKISKALNIEWYDLYEGTEPINKMKLEFGYDEYVEAQAKTSECPQWDKNDKVFIDFLELNESGQYIALQTVLEILDRRLKHSTALKFKYFVDLLRNEAYDSIKNILTPDETVNNYAFEALREVYDRVHELTNIPSCKKKDQGSTDDEQKENANETRWYR